VTLPSVSEIPQCKRLFGEYAKSKVPKVGLMITERPFVEERGEECVETSGIGRWHVGHWSVSKEKFDWPQQLCCCMGFISK
jgi:hypothetical protein